MILSDALILYISQLQTEQVITSQIRSHTEYLIHHHQFICHIFISNCIHISCNGRPRKKNKVQL